LTSGTEQRGSEPQIRRALFIRAGCAVGLLAAEYLLLAVAFDGSQIAENVGSWSRLSSVGKSVAVAVAILGAGLIRRRSILVEAFGELAGALGPVKWQWAGLHGLIFVGFVGCTAQVFAPGGLSSGFASLLVAGWVLLGLATLVSLLRAAFGGAWRVIAVALLRLAWSGLALGVLAYFAAFRSQQYWPWLAKGTLTLSATLLEIVSSDVRVVPSELLLGLGAVDVEVSEPCSGAEGVTLVFVLLAGYLFTARRHLRFPRALLVLPLGVLTVWVLNAVRVAGLVAIGAWVSPAIAFGGFHSKAGWVAVCAVALAAVWLTERAPFFARNRTPLQNAYNPVAVYCLPLLVLIVVGMLTSLFAADVDWLYGVRLLGAAAVLYAYRREYAGLVTRPARAALLAGVAVFALWLALVSSGTSVPPGAAFTHAGPAAQSAWLVSRIVGTVFFVPIAEELAFRGFLQRRLIASNFERVPQNRFTWPSLVVTALAFGLLHEHFVAGTLAGLGYSLVGYRRGRLADCVAAHATTNLLLAGAALAFERWDLLG
jgi:exosortase E/protease (VPEID-CTERM system)